ncbi:MAG: hypothetical protein ACRC62_01345 [Microcoleus sp.]
MSYSSKINALADELMLPHPKIWEVQYESDATLLHELGHWAVTPGWAIEWWEALSPWHHRKSIAPPIPYLFHPGQVLPDDLAVVTWTSEVCEAMGWEFDSVPTILLGDRPSIRLPEAGLERSVADLRRFGIDPKMGQFTPINDGFRLPHPVGVRKPEIVENWQAIAEFYSDRCASDFKKLSPELESLLDRQLALGNLVHC